MTHINLHIHTNHSDGIFSVKEVLEKSKSNGLRIISITDHDNITGSLEAINMIEDDSIEDIFDGNYKTKLNSESFFRSLLTWQNRNNMHIYFVKKAYMGKMIYELCKNCLDSKILK